MAGAFSDGEDSVGHEAELVDVTADTEVDLRLPLREPILQDRPREEIPIHSGVLDLAATDLAEQRRRAPPSGAKPKGSGHGLSLPLVLSTCWDLRSPGGGGRCLRAGNSLSRTLLGQAFHEGLIQIMVPERGKGIPCF